MSHAHNHTAQDQGIGVPAAVNGTPYNEDPLQESSRGSNTDDLLRSAFDFIMQTDVLSNPTLSVKNILPGKSIKLIVKSESQQRTFLVPKALICSYSDYFSGLFDGNFSEAELLESQLENTEPWAVSIFVTWLHSHKLMFPVEDEPLNAAIFRTFGAKRFGSGNHENEADYPVTWSWDALFALYIFADKYDSRLFRQVVMEKIAFKMLQIGPKIYYLPGLESIAFLMENLPASSPLRRYITWDFARAEGGFHEYAEEWTKLSPEASKTLPPDFLLKVIAAQRRFNAATACDLCGPRSYGDQIMGEAENEDRSGGGDDLGE